MGESRLWAPSVTPTQWSALQFKVGEGYVTPSTLVLSAITHKCNILVLFATGIIDSNKRGPSHSGGMARETPPHSPTTLILSQPKPDLTLPPLLSNRHDRFE